MQGRRDPLFIKDFLVDSDTSIAVDSAFYRFRSYTNCTAVLLAVLLQWCLDLVYHYLVNYKNAGNRAWSHRKSTISTSFYTVTLQVESILSVRKCNQNQLSHQLKKSIKNYFI